MDNLDINKFSGLWYEVAYSMNIPYRKGDFGTIEYKTAEKNNMTVEHKLVRRDGSREHHKGDMLMVNPSHYKIKYKTNWVTKLLKDDFRIADTDYENYAICYARSRVIFWKNDYAWLLLRNRTEDEKVLNSLIGKLSERTGITKENIRITRHVENVQNA